MAKRLAGSGYTPRGIMGDSAIVIQYPHTPAPRIALSTNATTSGVERFTAEISPGTSVPPASVDATVAVDPAPATTEIDTAGCSIESTRSTIEHAASVGTPGENSIVSR